MHVNTSLRPLYKYPMPDLEEECSWCDGNGRRMENPYNPCISIDDNCGPCEQCKGKGYIITPEGQMLLAFLNRHFQIKTLAESSFKESPSAKV